MCVDYAGNLLYNKQALFIDYFVGLTLLYRIIIMFIP